MSYLTEFIRSVFPRGLRLTIVSLFFVCDFYACSTRKFVTIAGRELYLCQPAEQVVVIAGVHLHGHQIAGRKTRGILDNHGTIDLWSIGA